MSETAQTQERTIQNLSQRFNENLSNPTTATVTSLTSMVVLLEAQTVALEKEKRIVEDRLEKQKESIPRSTMLDSRARNEQLMEDLDKARNSMIDSRSHNKKLMEDLAKVKEDLILTQEELASTKRELTSARKDLTFSESALKLLQGRAKDSDAEDAEMEDFDSDFHAGISRARREIDSLKEKLRQSEQETHNLTDRLDDKIKESMIRLSRRTINSSRRTISLRKR